MSSDNAPSCSGSCSLRTPEAPHNAHLALQPRRSFVKTIALMSAGSWLGGKELESIFVADIHAQSSSQVGVFRVNLDSFPALKNELGSVRMKVTGMPSSFSQIIITLEGGEYKSVTSRCTHEGTTVNPYTSAGNINSLRCPQHGSRFAPDGTVLLGPAGQPLTRYNTTFDGVKTVAVEIPGLGFDITTAAVLHPTTGASRLRIEFPSVNTVRYAVKFRASLTSGDWATIPFSTTIDGAAATNELTGNNTRRSVFVDRVEQLGFYAVTRTS